MGLDIKIPIGLMFAIFGILLTIFGIATAGDDMYTISIGKNINLISGIGMIVFGGFMLLISDLVRKKSLGPGQELSSDAAEEAKED